MNNTPETDLDLSKLFLPDWVQNPPSSGHIEELEEEEKASLRQKERRKGRARGRFAPVRQRPQRVEKPKEKLPELEVSFVLAPEDVEVIAKQIKATAKAYPIFDIARLILRYPERYSLKFASKRGADGQLLQPLYICNLDETVWLSEDEVASYILDKHFEEFYQVERIPTEPPKGKYTFVAKCGLSGIILGPPNHHEYQTKLIKLHAERFSHMPFEEYKSHIKIVRDEEVVKKWIEEQSWKTQYICLNVPEPIRLESREAVDLHFKQVHLPNLVRQVDSVVLSGSQARSVECRRLRQLARLFIAREKEFPINLVRTLSDHLSKKGLQFFKVQKITHVGVARPRYLDLEVTPVSENVRRIIKYVIDHPGCTRKELVEALAPSPQTEIPIGFDGGVDQQPQPTPEQLAILADLHWLILQGHVVEFYNGKLDTAKRPKRAHVTRQSTETVKQAQLPQSSQAADSSQASINPDEKPEIGDLEELGTEGAKVPHDWENSDTQITEATDCELTGRPQIEPDSPATQQVS